MANSTPGGLNLLTATEARVRLDRREITVEQLVRDCLDRIEAREPEIDAWAFLDPDLALSQARQHDNTSSRGLLHGIPIGIKDIFDTADMPTAYGSGVYEGHRPASDSDWVRVLRTAGAIILGKSRTTEFATPYPTTTRNPHDLERTPGVSSSGSVAAVADFMVPLATGSQTGGSVIRPASLCGVYGYKPSFDAFPKGGVRHAKASIDTPGLFARSLDDVALMRAASLGTELKLAAPDDSTPLRIGVCRTDHWAQALPETVAMITTTAEIFADAGAVVTDVELPTQVTAAMAGYWTIVATEDAHAIAAEARDHLDRLNPWSQKIVREAQDFTTEQYAEALAVAERARAHCDEFLAPYDALITPSAPGEAPQGLTGVHLSPFNAVWTLMYTPCLSLPAFTGPAGMPVGLQVVAKRGMDQSLLAVGRWIESCLAEAFGSVPAPIAAASS